MSSSKKSNPQALSRASQNPAKPSGNSKQSSKQSTSVAPTIVNVPADSKVAPEPVTTNPTEQKESFSTYDTTSLEYRVMLTIESFMNNMNSKINDIQAQINAKTPPRDGKKTTA